MAFRTGRFLPVIPCFLLSTLQHVIRKTFLNYKSSHKPDDPSLLKTLHWFWKMFSNSEMAARVPYPTTYACYLAQIVREKKSWILRILNIVRRGTHCPVLDSNSIVIYPGGLTLYVSGPAPVQTLDLRGHVFHTANKAVPDLALPTFLISFHAFNSGLLMPRLMFICYTTLMNATSLNPWAYEMWEANADNKWSNKLKWQGRSMCGVGVGKRDQTQNQWDKVSCVGNASKDVASHLFWCQG